MFRVYEEINYSTLKISDGTKHMMAFRNKRMKAYKKYASVKFIKAFICMAGTDNNINIHAINEHGLIYIIDIHSKELVTVIHPRPSQLKRYWIQRDRQVPRPIKEMANECAKRNQKAGLNEK